MTTSKDHHIWKHVLLENPGARPLVEIQNPLGFQVSSGLKANHSVVVISWGIKMLEYNSKRPRLGSPSPWHPKSLSAFNWKTDSKGMRSVGSWAEASCSQHLLDFAEFGTQISAQLNQVPQSCGLCTQCCKIHRTVPCQCSNGVLGYTTGSGLNLYDYMTKNHVMKHDRTLEVFSCNHFLMLPFTQK